MSRIAAIFLRGSCLSSLNCRMMSPVACVILDFIFWNFKSKNTSPNRTSKLLIEINTNNFVHRPYLGWWVGLGACGQNKMCCNLCRLVGGMAALFILRRVGKLSVVFTVRSLFVVSSFRVAGNYPLNAPQWHLFPLWLLACGLHKCFKSVMLRNVCWLKFS